MVKIEVSTNEKTISQTVGTDLHEIEISYKIMTDNKKLIQDVKDITERYKNSLEGLSNDTAAK